MMATTVAFAGFLFVDDTDLIALSASKEDTAEQVAVRLQEAVRVWHGGLRATGGALKPEKCSWSLADFRWVHGKWRYTPMEDVPGDINAPGSISSPLPEKYRLLLQYDDSKFKIPTEKSALAKIGRAHV
jgi:hypothetical protein